jgi:feruloyl esterase
MNRWLLCATLSAVPAIALGQTPCDQLKSLKLTDTTITLAESAGPGAFPLPGAPPTAAAPLLPAFCRVAATLKPSLDSEIRIEVWLPAPGSWNGKYLAVGGGGWVGSINYGAMAAALQEGYATSSTDTGHTGGTAEFAVGHPEKVTDFAYRAVHEMTVKAKTIMAAQYGRVPRHSYWTGCSTGGRQGLLEAQRYPADFDGIIAGAPANNQIQLCAWRFALETGALKDPARVVPLAKTAMLNRAVLAACDALDGVPDGFLSDPQKCRFDPSALLCRGSETGNCFTAPQLESVKQA